MSDVSINNVLRKVVLGKGSAKLKLDALMNMPGPSRRFLQDVCRKGSGPLKVRAAELLEALERYRAGGGTSLLSAKELLRRSEEGPEDDNARKKLLGF